MKIVTSDEMAGIEQACARAGVTTAALMENAGRAFAAQVERILEGAADKGICVLVGPGNNGGDGLVAARFLHDGGARVTVGLCGPRPQGDKNLALVLARGIDCFTLHGAQPCAELEKALNSAEAAVDAVFGTGRKRPIVGVFAAALEQLVQHKRLNPGFSIFALDVPSGLDSDSGEADPLTPVANYTITLGLPKYGLFTHTGAARAGQVTVVDIGIPPALFETLSTEQLTPDWARSAMPVRSPYAHKGTFGRALLVVGSQSYSGAAILAASGAARSGVGLVTLAVTPSLQRLISASLAEATWLPLSEESPFMPAAAAVETVLAAVPSYDAILIGSGLGQALPVQAFLTRLMQALGNRKVVIDADGLNALPGIPEWWQALPFRAVLTPHPGEMARLLGTSVAEVESSRIGAARVSAEKWGKTVVLKGAFTVIASPDGRIRLSPFANAGLASAGTGDVLAGVITALLAQGLDAFDAASLGVYLHALAAERVKQRLGDTGMLASDVAAELPLAIKEIKGGQNI
jgi:ADP-dependent NAD(P)H-hydrate dehydratase / NAD(P)H-hydrate epimerase